MGKPSETMEVDLPAAAAAKLDKHLQTSAKAPGTADLRQIELVDLAESPTNPRRYFNEDKLKELADSVRQSGVLVPLIVRAVKRGGFEIVAGARRFRAAKLAGLAEAPCLVREYSDVQALVIQVVENEQRDDITPLDQAEGYAALIKAAKMDVDAIASKVGKSASFVYQRLKLAELIEPAKKALAEGVITAGHAILIARLDAQQQHKAMERCVQRQNWGDKEVQTLSVRSLDTWIQREIHVDLSKAPWKLDDKELLPGAGACSACKHNTACQANLYADLKGKPQCLQASCFNKKLDAFTKSLKKESEKSGEKCVEVDPSTYQNKGGVLGYTEWRPSKRGCEKPIKAVCREEGENHSHGRTYQLGEVLEVCTDKKCKKCWPSNSGGYSAPKPSKAELERRKKEKAQQEIDDKVRGKILLQLAKQTKKLERKHIHCLVKSVQWNADDELLKLIGWPDGKNYFHFDPKPFAKLSDTELLAGVFVCCLAERLGANSTESVAKVAKEFGLNIDRLRNEVKAEMAGNKLLCDDSGKAAAPATDKAKAKPPTPAEVARVMKAEKKKLEKKSAAPKAKTKKSKK